jgi:hypothetical protein
MNYNFGRALIFLVMIGLALPGGLAVSWGTTVSSLGSESSSATQANLGVSDGMASSATFALDGGVQTTSTTSGSFSDAAVANVDEYWFWQSTNGKLYAAVYAFLSGANDWSYGVSGSSSATTAKASESIKMKEGTIDAFIGGFAYNSRLEDDGDYFSAQFLGNEGPLISMNYVNSFTAMSTMVIGSQTITPSTLAGSPKGVNGKFLAVTWAEVGNSNNEVRNKAGLYKDGDPVIGPQGDNLYNQLAYADAKIESDSSVSKYASSGGSSAARSTVYQSLLTKAVTGSGKTSLSALTLSQRDLTEDNLRSTSVEATVVAANAISYTSSATDSGSSGKATHTLTAMGAESASKAGRSSYIDHYVSTEASVNQLSAGNRADFSIKDAMTAGVNYAKGEETISKARGGEIERSAMASSANGYNAESVVTVESLGNGIYSQFSLSGGKVQADGNQAAITGYAKGTVEKGGSIHRTAAVFNEDEREDLAISKSRKYYYGESIKATGAGVRLA